MSMKKTWHFEGWEIIPSYFVLPTERQTFWCERGDEFKILKPFPNAKTRKEVEALL